jgi:hypothetical protein
VCSAGSLAGAGCLEKEKRGFEGPGRVLISVAGVGRKERLSMEATLVPLATLHMVTLAFPSAHYMSPHSNVPGLGEVVRAFSRAQRHFRSPSQRWIADGRRRSRCGYCIGGACLAQPAAVLCRLLEFADSILCHRGSVL